MNDGAQVALLGGHQREPFLQIETHLVAENRQRASAGTVGFRGALGEHFVHQIQILFHLFLTTVVAAGDDDTPKSS
ncbi:hypothetical protein D3C86_2033410 [compost metagenome]